MKFSIILCLSVITLLGCSESRRDQDQKHIVVEPNNKEHPRPVTHLEYGYQIARDATEIQDVSVFYDAKKHLMFLNGRVKYLSAQGGGVKVIPLDLSGPLHIDDYVFLRQSATNSLEVKVGAKMTCLTDSASCDASFVDLYIVEGAVIYHHQFTLSKEQDEPPAPTEAETSEDEEVLSEDEKNKTGEYVGTRVLDIESLFGIPSQKKGNPKKPRPEPPVVKPPEKEQPSKEIPGRGSPTPSPSPVPGPAPAPSPHSGPENEGTGLGLTESPRPLKKPTRPTVDTTLFPSGEQAIGGPARSDGRLVNATSLLDVQRRYNPAGFRILHPSEQTYFGTKEMAIMMLRIGDFAKKNRVPHAAGLGDVSARRGGKLSGHSSHRNGMDADITYFFNNMSTQSNFVKAVHGRNPQKNWMQSLQWQLFKHLVQTNHVDRIFVDAGIKKAMCRVAINNGEIGQSSRSGTAFETLRRLNIEPGHDGHFHLRLKCSENNSRCWKMAAPEAITGCF